MKMNTLRLLTALLLTTLFAACNRPVAYFQPSPRETFATVPITALPKTADETVTATPVAQVASANTASPTEQITQAEAALNQVNALVRNDGKIIADKSLQKRMGRVQTLLASASAKATAAPSTVNASRKANLVERLMVKKLNKKINRQLAPQNPNKPMISTGILATGAVLVLIGLLLVLLTSGTGVTVGVIVLLAGAVLLLVGLL